MNFKTVVFTGVVALLSNPAWSNDYGPELQKLADGKIRALVNDSAIVESIIAQNKANTGLSQEKIIALDTQWRQEVDQASGPLIDTVLKKTISAKLKSLVDEEQGLFTEIFVMDNHGLNVGQSGLTSDYWQGDEAKWQETYLQGADAVHISEIEFDESSQTYQAQVSVSVADPQSGLIIGAVTFGVNADAI